MGFGVIELVFYSKKSPFPGPVSQGNQKRQAARLSSEVGVSTLRLAWPARGERRLLSCPARSPLGEAQSHPGQDGRAAQPLGRRQPLAGGQARDDRHHRGEEHDQTGPMGGPVFEQIPVEAEPRERPPRPSVRTRGSVLFLVDNLGLVWWWNWRTFWPVALILVGLFLLGQRARG